MASKEVQKQVDALGEGLVDFITEDDLAKKIELSLAEKRPLRIKYGADPSAPDLHLGHTVPLRKLKQFQDFGHTIVFIVGDFTAMIGDPTQRSETRKMLTRDEVNRNSITYQHQVFKILDPKKTETRYNSEWLSKMTPDDFLRLTTQATVAQLLERDDFNNRYKSGKPIAVVEFLYPLLQGHDSVMINADVEVGGTDQTFNLLMGRELQRQAGTSPQVVMTLPIIEGTDGVQKMSKSLGNAIAIEETPKEMFGKIMSIPDALMKNYYIYASGLPRDEVKKIVSELEGGKVHPREAKVRLGKQIVSLYHDAEAGEKAFQEFEEIFKNKGLPDEIDVVELDAASLDIVSVLKDAGLVSSKGEARRMVQQGAVRVEREKVEDIELQVDLSSPVLIQCGKRKFAKVKVREN